MKRAAGILFAFAAALAACASRSPRDAAVEGVEERRDDANASASSQYEYVARRPHATVALAEGRGLDKSEAAAATDRIADSLEACARELTADQNGLLRLVAHVGDDGAVDGVSVPVQSGHAPTALRCVVAPVKLLIFQHLPPRAEGEKSRGLALEAEWRPG